jgi:hypothetical protein
LNNAKRIGSVSFGGMLRNSKSRNILLSRQKQPSAFLTEAKSYDSLPPLQRDRDSIKSLISQLPPSLKNLDRSFNS